MGAFQSKIGLSQALTKSLWRFSMKKYLCCPDNSVLRCLHNSRHEIIISVYLLSAGDLLWDRLHRALGVGGGVCDADAAGGLLFLPLPLLWELRRGDASETPQKCRLPAGLLHSHTRCFIHLHHVSLRNSRTSQNTQNVSGGRLILRTPAAWICAGRATNGNLSSNGKTTS